MHLVTPSIRSLLIALLAPLALCGQATEGSSPLVLRQIMEGERFVGFLPEDPFWSLDSRHLYFSWNPEQDTLRHLYRVAVAGGEPERVGLEEQRLLPRTWTFNQARDQAVYEIRGDLFLYDMREGQARRLTSTSTRETDPYFALEDQCVVFQREGNLFAWHLAEGTLTQLTDLREGTKDTEPDLPEYRQWLADQQLDLFRVRRDRETASTLRERRSDSLQLDHPEAVYLGKSRAFNLQASPDLRFLSFTLYRSAEAENTEVPQWVTQSGYVDVRNARAKVGSPQGSYQLGLIDRQRDTFYTVDTEQIPGIREKPEFLRAYHRDTSAYAEQYEDPRPVRMLGPFYHDDGRAVVVVRSLDNKDRWIMQLHPEDGKLQLLDRQHDDAWIGGPGISGWNASAGTIGWLPGTDKVYFQSEASGYSHLYTVDVETGQREALTSGDWEVRNVQLTPDERFFLLTANREGPDQQHVYRLPVAGGELQRLTQARGNHQATLSPDGRQLATRYSFSNRPWELFVQDAQAGAEPRQLTRSTTGAFRAYPWREPELVRFSARDGADVPARLYRPADAEPGGPAVIFVHGAGYLQNVHSWWSSYYREYMFHNFLADQGYTVLDIDYRGSDGYGRDWRTAIYQHMGGKDLSDQVDGARFLVDAYEIDPDRIGIYGGSYGGFITLMAMFNASDTFRAGAALRSVTDWAHYNHGYTSNILNTPVEDPEAYARSSPINFAEGLTGHLLILHGMVDANVQFQDVVRLAQRLIELQKEHWAFAVFPVEGHGFVEPSSWTDEYRRIFELFETHLK